jgi:hypothetical protein
MSATMMKCGCAANGICNGKPVCAVHYGMTPDAEIEVAAPDLVGRMAECTYCDTKVPSKVTLAFFAHRPEKETDLYYCGCYGWD